MPIAGAAVAAGGSLIGGNQNAAAAQDAANAGAQGSRDAINAGLAVYNQQRGDNYNGMIVGNSALNRIADMYGLDYYNGVPSIEGISVTGGETSVSRPSTMQRMLDPGGLIWSQESSTTPMQFSGGGSGSGTGYGTGTGGNVDNAPVGGNQGQIVRGDGEADFSSFYETPDFIVRRDEAMQGRDRTAAARGRLNSGGHEADVMRLSADLGAQGYGGYLNTLFNLAGHGSNATNTVTSAGGQFGANTGSYLQNMGNARASGYAAAGQARSDALNGVGSAFGDLWGQSQQNRNNPGWT